MVTTQQRDKSQLEYLDSYEVQQEKWDKFGHDDGELVRLWDRLEESWTEPLDAFMAQSTYLRMVSLACSGCGYTDFKEGQVDKHIRQTVEGVKTHQRAELIMVNENGSIGTACSVCKQKFMARPLQSEKHLERFSQQAGSVHRDAREVRFKRYSLEPTGSITGMNGHRQETVPEDIQEARSLQPAPGRGRRRGRRGGRRNR